MLMNQTQYQFLVVLLCLNREVDAATAKKMHAVFLEIIIAPSYSDEALEILTTKKKNMRILQLPFDVQEASQVEKEYTGVVGGLLVQNQDVIEENPADWKVVTKRQPTDQKKQLLNLLGNQSNMLNLTVSS